MVYLFQYLVRTLSVVYDDCTEVIFNLHKSRKVWYHLLRILGREGSYPRTSGRLYVAVMQATLILR